METSSFGFEPARGVLAGLPLFQGLTNQQLLLAQTALHRKHVPAGHVLMSEKQVGEIVYVIAEGAVRICVKRNDEQIIIGLRGVGDILGEMSVIDGDRRSATVITQSDCALYWMTRADFWETLWPMPQFSLNLTGILTKRIRNLSGQLEAMATLSVQGRLARLMLDLARDYGCPGALEDAPQAIEIPFRLTQSDLANMIGATRVQVNQVIHGWKKRGLLRVQNSRLFVLNEDALRLALV